MIFAFSAIIIVVTIAVFYITPTLSNKTKNYICLACGILLGVLLLIPQSFYSGIKLPIINQTIEEFGDTVISNNAELSDLIAFDSNIGINIKAMINKIIVGSVFSILFGIIVFFVSLITWLVHIINIRRNVVLSTIGTCIVLFLSLIFISSPMFSVVEISNQLNLSVARENETVVETYPEYQNYNKIFNFLNDDSNIFNVENENLLTWVSSPTNLFSMNNSATIIDELKSINPMLLKLKDSGITKIFTDSNFSFANIDSDTFDFTIMKELIKQTLNSKLVNNTARSFTNKIMEKLEITLKQDSGNSGDPDLIFTSKMFKNEYQNLIDLFAFVVDKNLVSFLGDNYDNFNMTNFVSNLPDLISQIGIDGILPSLSILGFPIVQRVAEYLNLPSSTVILGYPVGAALYTCARLYKMLDNWLIEFRLESMYQSSINFLNIRQII